MATIWILSDDPALGDTLAPALAGLGRVVVGRPERSAWKAETGPPDLLVLAATGEERGRLDGLERLLEFVRSVEHPQRVAPGVLYIEPSGGHPAAALAISLIDDRAVRAVRWPLDPVELANAAADPLDPPGLLPTLRERAQRDWVQRQVELYYAGLELPTLRQAIDPRNAARPVLLIGEPGSMRGLLARYIHLLAEPPRQTLVVLPASALHPGSIEGSIGMRTSGRRVSLYLPDLDKAEPGAQDELAQLLGQGGLLGVEPIRWVASSVGGSTLSRDLRALPWLRVALPALRARSDLPDMVEHWLDLWQQHSGRRPRVAPEALALLRRYAWPGNLAELDRVLEAAATRARGGLIEVDALSIQRASPRPIREPDSTVPPDPSPETASTGEATPGVRFEGGEPIDLGPVDESPPTSPAPPGERDSTPRAPVGLPAMRELISPLAVEVREPVLAIRTYASLLDQRPGDENVRRELSTLLDGDLARIEETLQRLERFAAFGPPVPEPVDLADLVASELERRRERIRKRSLILLEELDRQGPSALADPEQLRFAVGGILDRALRMVPDAADLYVGSQYLAARSTHPNVAAPAAPGATTRTRSRQRLLIRFHSPEEVLVAPSGVPGPPMPLEVVIAKALIVRMGGAFAADASGAQDNMILLELPAIATP